MKKCWQFLMAICFWLPALQAQESDTLTARMPRIAVFTPIYLDSAFNDLNEYRYSKNEFPKFINPGLEFYEGVQMALDSLALEGEELEVFVYDTRSTRETLKQQLARAAADSVDILLVNCTSQEVKPFAEFARSHQIPFINTSIPNDGGIQNNPYLVILNPTLKTQCEGIYRHLQKYFALNPIVVFRRKGSTENYIRSIWDEFGKQAMGSPIHLKYVDLPDSFTVQQLTRHLDSTAQNVVLAGTLDPNFGRRLALQLAGIHKRFPVTIVGMPTWENLSKEFTKPEFKGPDIVYSNPFYNPRTDQLSQEINSQFAGTMYARPSDMVFRGYEVTWNYAKLLLQYREDLASNLGNKSFLQFTNYDIQPVMSKPGMQLQYFENKRLYFLYWQDGIIRMVREQ